MGCTGSTAGSPTPTRWWTSDQLHAVEEAPRGDASALQRRRRFVAVSRAFRAPLLVGFALVEVRRPCFDDVAARRRGRIAGAGVAVSSKSWRTASSAASLARRAAYSRLKPVQPCLASTIPRFVVAKSNRLHRVRGERASHAPSRPASCSFAQAPTRPPPRRWM
jgi:hypothetical protein